MGNLIIGLCQLLGLAAKFCGVACTAMFILHWFGVMDFKVCAAPKGACSVTSSAPAGSAHATPQNGAVVITAPEGLVDKIKSAKAKIDN